jgi:hypothetical protein
MVELTGLINITSNVLNSLLGSGSLESTTTIVSNTVDGILIFQVKCINCKLNDDTIKPKSIIKCSRTARYQDNNNKIRCNMYLYKG